MTRETVNTLFTGRTDKPSMQDNLAAGIVDINADVESFPMEDQFEELVLGL